MVAATAVVVAAVAAVVSGFQAKACGTDVMTAEMLFRAASMFGKTRVTSPVMTPQNSSAPQISVLPGFNTKALCNL